MKKFALSLSILLLSTLAFTQVNEDCSNAYELTNETELYYTGLAGPGSVDDLGNLCDLVGQEMLAETSSFWIKLQAKKSGNLYFTITPDMDTDDIDFVVYKLNDQGECDSKEAIRCMFSGETAGQDSATCHGPTGLSPDDTDTSEAAGCSEGDNNFLSDIQVEADEYYLIYVNHFSFSGEGYKIEFFGDGVTDSQTSNQSYDQWEYLTHQNQSRASNSLATDDGLFYVDNSFASSVKYIGKDGVEKTIHEEAYLSYYMSEFVRLNDNDWILYVYQLVDYDVILPGYQKLVYLNGELKIDYIDFQDIDCCYEVADLLHLENEDVLVLSYNHILLLDKQGNVIKESEHNLSGYGLLYQNQEGDFFMTDRNHIIYSLDEDLNHTMVSESLNNIRQFVSYGDDKTAIIADNSIFVYDNQLLEEDVMIYHSEEEIIHIGAEGDEIYALVKQEEGYQVSKFKNYDDVSLLHEETCGNFWSNGFSMYDEHIFLYGWTHGSSYHKAIQKNETFDDTVERPAISIDKYEVRILEEKIVYDTILTGEIYEYTVTDYDYELVFTNTGNVNIEDFDYYISYTSMPWFTAGVHGSYTNESIEPGEQVTKTGFFSFDSQFWFANFNPSKVIFPGANRLPFCDGFEREDPEIELNTGDPETLNLVIYPNPVNDVLHIDNIKEELVYQIFNSTGVAMTNGIINRSASTISVADLPTGVYFLNFGYTNYKFVKTDY